MSEFAIEVEGGSSVRLPTAGKYCDRDIVVTAKGGGGAIEHTYTVDYTPSVNTKALTIPIKGFSKTPLYVQLELVSDISEITGLQCIRFFNASQSQRRVGFVGHHVITIRATFPVLYEDWWNFNGSLTVTATEFTIDASAQNSWEFYAGCTYRFLFVGTEV